MPGGQDPNSEHECGPWRGGGCVGGIVTTLEHELGTKDVAATSVQAGKLGLENTVPNFEFGRLLFTAVRPLLALISFL